MTNKKFRAVKNQIPVEVYQTDKPLDIKTLEGTMHANAGDYIITGIKGEQYPCAKEIFEETYTHCKDNYCHTCGKLLPEENTDYIGVDLDYDFYTYCNHDCAIKDVHNLDKEYVLIKPYNDISFYGKMSGIDVIAYDSRMNTYSVERYDDFADENIDDFLETLGTVSKEDYIRISKYLLNRGQ